MEVRLILHLFLDYSHLSSLTSQLTVPSAIPINWDYRQSPRLPSIYMGVGDQNSTLYTYIASTFTR